MAYACWNLVCPSLVVQTRHLLAKKYYDESIEEMKHAEDIIDRILFLEGVPDMQKYHKVMVGATVPDQFENDLEALTSTRIPVRVSGNLASPTIRPDTQKLLEDRARDEVENVVKDKLKDLFDR